MNIKFRIANISEKCPECQDCDDGDVCLFSSTFDVSALYNKGVAGPFIPVFVSGTNGERGYYQCEVKE